MAVEGAEVATCRELLAAERNIWPRLSPDGQRVMVVRDVGDGQELWLWAADGTSRRVAAHPDESIVDLRWSADGSVLWYRHSHRGREQWRLSGVRADDPAGVAVPAPGTVIEYWLDGTGPTGVAFAAYDAGARRRVLYRAAPAPAAGGVPVPAHPVDAGLGFHRWLVDGALRPRGGIRMLPDGCLEIVVGDDPDSAKTLLRMDITDVATLSVERFSPDGTVLYALTSSGAPTRRLVAVDCRTGAVETRFAHPVLDVDSYPIAGQGVWFSPRTGHPDICTVMDARLRFHPLGADPAVTAGLAWLAAAEGTVLIDRSADDSTWLTVQVRDDGPIEYQLLDVGTGVVRPLFVNRPGLAGRRLSRLTDLRCRARDGLRLTGYAMRPLTSASPRPTGPDGADGSGAVNGSAAADGTAAANGSGGRRGPWPTVVLVHGGPAGRDYWRLHAEAQYLACLGYLSLHVNYRGSRGFGSAFRLAGDGQWGAAMQHDLYDALAAASADGLADAGRVAFMGGSYGGYAALLAACTRPDLVRCAVAVSPPCDLTALTERPPAYWQPLSLQLRRHVLGPASAPLDPAELARRSPQHAVRPGSAPMLIAHGVRDPRVPVAGVDRFVATAREAGVPVTYLRFDDEGHHVVASANRRVLFQAIASFLEAHLVDPNAIPVRADGAPTAAPAPVHQK